MSQHSHHGAHGGAERDKLPEEFKVQMDLNRPGQHESHQKNYSAVATVPADNVHTEMEIEEVEQFVEFKVQVTYRKDGTDEIRNVKIECTSKLFKQLQFMCEHEGLQNVCNEKLSKLKGATRIIFSPEKDVKTNVVCGYVFSMQNELNEWWKKVRRTMKDVVKEVLVVVLDCNNEEIFKRLLSESLVKNKEVSLSFYHRFRGIWICGMPEAVLCFLQQTTAYRSMSSLFDPETNAEVIVHAQPLSQTHIRLILKFKILDEIRNNEKDTQLLLDEERKLILIYGAKEKVQGITNYLAGNMWSKGLRRSEMTISADLMCFLQQKEIEQYIDQKLVTKMASWITEKTEGVLRIFVMENEDLDLTLRIISESCQKKELKVKYQDTLRSKEYGDWISSLNIKFPGKIMVIPEKSVVRFYATDDIFKELCMEIATFEKKIAACTGEVGHQAREDHRTEKKSDKLVTIPLSAGMSKFLVKEECMNIIREIADNSEVKFEFTPDMEIVLRGMQEGVDSVKKYIEDNFLRSLKTCETSIKEPLMVWTLKEDGYKVFEDIEKQFECDINTQCSEWKIGSVLIVVQQGNIKETVDVIVKTGDRKEGSWIGNLKEYCIPIQSESNRKASTDLAKNFEDMFQEVCGKGFQTVSIQMSQFKEMREKTVVKAVFASLRELIFPRNARLKKVFLHDSSLSICEKVKKCFDETSGFPLISNVMKKDETCKMEVTLGQLTEEKVDVIVNTTSQDLRLKEGKVSGTILKAAGSTIQDQITHDYPDGVKFGMVAITGGHNLKCHKVYHGALKPWGLNPTTNIHSKKVLQTFISNCLHEMDRGKLSSIAFPVLGSGMLKIPVDVFTNVLVDVVESHEELHPVTSVKNIRVIVYGGPGGIKGQLEEIKDAMLKRKNVKKTSTLGDQHICCIGGNHITVKPFDQTKGKTGEYDARIYLWNSQTLYDETNRSRFRDETSCDFNPVILPMLQKDQSAVLEGKLFPLIIHVLVVKENYEEALEIAFLNAANERKCTNAYIGFAKSDFYGKDCQKFTKAVSKTFRLMTGWKENISELTIGVEKAFMNNMIQALSADDLSGQTDRKIGPLEIIKSTVHLEITAEKEKVHSIHDALMHMLHDRKDRLLLERNDAQAANEKPEISPKTHSDSNLVKEPGVQEISRDAQNGNQEEDQENDVWVPPTSQSKPVTIHNDQQNKEILPQQTTEIPEKQKSGIHLVLTEDEKCCVILTARNNTLVKDEVLKTLEGHSVSLVVYPFFSSNDGLIKCASAKDADLLIGKEFAKFSLSAFPPQAANNIKAVLTPGVIEILKNVPDIVSQVHDNSGACLYLEEKTLCGNLLEIQVAEKFIKNVINSQIHEKSVRMSHSLKNENTGYEKETKHVEIQKQSFKGKEERFNKTTSEMRKETIKCSSLEYDLLRHFFNDLPLNSTHSQRDEDGNVKFSGKSGLINDIKSALEKLYKFPHQTLKNIEPGQFQQIRNIELKHKDDFHLHYEEREKQMCITAKTVDVLTTVENDIEKILQERNDTKKKTVKPNSSSGSFFNDQTQQNAQAESLGVESKLDQTGCSGTLNKWENNTTKSSTPFQRQQSDPNVRPDYHIQGHQTDPTRNLDAHNQWQESAQRRRSDKSLNNLENQDTQQPSSSIIDKYEYDLLMHFRKDVTELKPKHYMDDKFKIDGNSFQIRDLQKALTEVHSYPSRKIPCSVDDIGEVANFFTEHDSPDVFIKVLQVKESALDSVQIVCKDVDTLERLSTALNHKLGFIRKVSRRNENSDKKNETSNFVKKGDSKPNDRKYSSGINYGKQSNTNNVKHPRPPTSSTVYSDKEFKMYFYTADLFNIKVDAIINPSNAFLNLRYGISGKIMRAVGSEIRHSCSDHVRNQSLRAGEVFVTGGVMHYTRIFHVCTPTWKDFEDSADGVENCRKALRVAFSNCLYRADELKIGSLGCTPIGAGEVGGIPLQLAVMCFRSAAQQFHEHKPKSCLKEIHVIDTSDSIVGKMRKMARNPKPLLYKRVDNMWEVYLPCDILIRVYSNVFDSVKADILVVNEDEKFTGERFMVKKLLQMSCEDYSKAHSKLKKKHHSVNSIEVTDAPRRSNFKKVLHVVLPSKLNQQSHYQKCISKVLSEVSKIDKSCTNVFLPLLGAGRDPKWQQQCAETYADQIFKLVETKDKCYITCIDIVDTEEKTDLMKTAIEKKITAFQDELNAELIFVQAGSRV